MSLYNHHNEEHISPRGMIVAILCHGQEMREGLMRKLCFELHTQDKTIIGDMINKKYKGQTLSPEQIKQISEIYNKFPDHIPDKTRHPLAHKALMTLETMYHRYMESHDPREVDLSKLHETAKEMMAITETA